MFRGLKTSSCATESRSTVQVEKFLRPIAVTQIDVFQDILTLRSGMQISTFLNLQMTLR